MFIEVNYYFKKNKKRLNHTFFLKITCRSKFWDYNYNDKSIQLDCPTNNLDIETVENRYLELSIFILINLKTKIKCLTYYLKEKIHEYYRY